MSRILTGLVAAAGIAVAAQAGSAVAEEVIVVDAPDVQKLNPGSVGGFRTSEVIGTDVYSNAGKRIGEVEDFTYSRGHLYAVVDIQGGAIERYVELGDGETVVIPVNQLRVQNR